MFLVPTVVAESAIHGLGCFAAGRISIGTVVWRFDTRVDALMTEAELSDMCVIYRDFVVRYGYFDVKRSLWFLAGDNARFVNHSDWPNCSTTVSEADDESIAVRDIEAGEEITENYFDYDRDSRLKLRREEGDETQT